MVATKCFSLTLLLSLVFVVNSRSAFDEQLYQDVLDSDQCAHQLEILRRDSLRWLFIDASARIPSGVASGNLNDMGDYFQCLAISEERNSTNIEGKYCMVQAPIEQEIIQFPDLADIPWLPIRPSNNQTQVLQDYEYSMRLKAYAHNIVGGEPVEVAPRIFPLVETALGSISFAVCIPKVCTVEEAITFVLQQYPLVNPFIKINYTTHFCRLPNDKPFAPADYTAIGIFSFLGLLVVISTCYDLYLKFYLKKGNSKDNPLYTSFSVYTNTQRFLTFNSSAGALECIDGIRAISMFWVIIGHTYCMTLLGYIHNLAVVIEWLSKLSSVWITSAPIVVDTFFLISGILAVYTTIGKMSRAKFIRSLHLFYLNRLLRIFPLLATVVLLQASVLNHVSDGPFWLNVAHAAENCRANWWTALLYVQNYVNPLTICLAHSWYLSVDTQLYFICPIVLFFLFGRERIAWGILFFVLFLSLLSSSLYSFINNFSAALANPTRLMEFNEYVQYYYLNTLARAPPFVVGMIYGYMLYLCKDKKIEIPTIGLVLIWINSIGMMAFCIFSIHPVMQINHTAQGFDNFLNAYMRAIWGLSVGWLIFACVQGYGGPINWFLSLRIWKLPARMSFAMYLIHLPIIMIVNGSWVKTYYFTDASNIYKFFGDVSLTFLISFVICITIDAPFSTLQKLLMNRTNRRPRKPAATITVVEEDKNDTKTAL